jgi:hypothetical protein
MPYLAISDNDDLHHQLQVFHYYIIKSVKPSQNIDNGRKEGKTALLA